MPADQSIEENIKANARLVLSIANEKLGQNIGYDEGGVRWLDGYIERQREYGDPDDVNALIDTLGSFLGECILCSFGGAWGPADETWAVQFDNGNMVFPFAKVAKQFENGAGDSVLSLFTVIPAVFKLGRVDKGDSQ